MIIARTIWWGLFALAICSSWGLVYAVQADEPSGRAEEIRNRIAKIDDKNPIERIIAAEDTLSSEDPALRSLALERILRSDDPRVREIGFSYLVGAQKRLVINVDAPQKILGEIKKPYLQNFITKSPTFSISIENYDKKLGQFSGYVSGGGGVIRGTGSIVLDGLTVLFNLDDSCRLQFRKSEPTYLAGSLDCGPYSFLARSALP